MGRQVASCYMSNSDVLVLHTRCKDVYDSNHQLQLTQAIIIDDEPIEIIRKSHLALAALVTLHRPKRHSSNSGSEANRRVSEREA